MSFDETQIKRLRQLLTLLEPNAVTNKDFNELATALTKYIKDAEARLLKSAKELESAYAKKHEDLGNNHTESLTSLKEECLSLVGEETERLKTSFAKLEEAISRKIAEVKDGLDADEDSVTDKVLSRIEIPKITELAKELPMLGAEIRNALELLNDEERLDVSAIKGLEERLEALRPETPQRVGGGFSAMAMERHFIDDETPAGDKDGSNKEFTLARTPANGSLKLYRNGQRLRITEDYTLVGKTITLGVAPASDEILLADYRY